MKEQAINDINDVINYLFDLRFSVLYRLIAEQKEKYWGPERIKQVFEYYAFQDGISSDIERGVSYELNFSELFTLDDKIIKLNKTLPLVEQNDNVIILEKEVVKYKKLTSVEEQQIIETKKFVSPKELSKLLPNMSISQQQTYRGRLKDRIPYHQNVEGGKITYNVDEVKQWMENNNISR